MYKSKYNQDMIEIRLRFTLLFICILIIKDYTILSSRLFQKSSQVLKM